MVFFTACQIQYILVHHSSYLLLLLRTEESMANIFAKSQAHSRCKAVSISGDLLHCFSFIITIIFIFTTKCNYIINLQQSKQYCMHSKSACSVQNSSYDPRPLGETLIYGQQINFLFYNIYLTNHW